MEVFLLQFFDSLYNLINIDVKTTILILFWGNLFFLMMAFAFLISNTHISEKELFKKFIFSKLVQALGWIAFAFRGQIPEIVSVNLGNSLLYFGFYLESMLAIFAVPRPERAEVKILFTIAACSGLTTMFCLFQS